MLVTQFVKDFCMYKDIDCDVDVYVQTMLSRRRIAKDKDLERKCEILMDYLLYYGAMLPTAPHSSTPVEMIEHFEFFYTILVNTDKLDDSFSDMDILTVDENDLHMQMPCLMMSDVKKISKKFRRFYKDCILDHKLAKQIDGRTPAKDDLSTLLAHGVYAYSILKKSIPDHWIWQGVCHYPTDEIFEKMMKALFRFWLGTYFMYGLSGGKLLSYKGLVKHEP